MDNQRIWENLMELSIVCGMNQRYAQHMLTQAEFRSGVIDVLVVVTTMLTLALGVAAYLSPNRTMPVFGWWWGTWRVWRPQLDGVAMFTSIPAAIMGVVLIVAPYGDRVRHYGSTFQAWSDLRQDVDSAIVDADSKHPIGQADDEYLERRFRDLLAKKNTLNAREPAPNQDLLDKFLALEELSRGAADSKSSPAATNTSAVQPDGI